MKVYINENGNIVKVLDNVFVANSTTYDNTLSWFFVDENGNVYENTDIDYCSLSFKRSDGHIITRVNAPPEQTEEGWGFKYVCSQFDGILLVAGALEISAQFVHATIENNTIVDRETLCTVVVEGHIKLNYGIAGEEFFNDTLAQAMLDRDTLQAEIDQLDADLSNVQETLIGSGEGQNIKTINNESVLGQGNIDVVPKRLNTLTNLNTNSNRMNVLIYADNNGTPSKISMKEMFGLFIRQGASVPSDMQSGEYLFLEKGEQ